MSRVLVLQHIAVEGPGHLRAALERHGLHLDLVRVDLGQPVPDDLEAEALVVLGGPMGVADVDRLPHLADELRLLERALTVNLPTLGICLGSQLLAHALGARVQPSGGLELGWHAVELTPAGRTDAVFRVLPARLHALHWHGDVFSVPPGSAALARSAATPAQAFRHGRALGLLFHLEADGAQVAAMASAFPEEVERAGQGPTLADDTLRHAPAAHEALDTLVGAWLG